jgi:transcriptional regulator with XRE-family HTH domain
MSSTVQLRRLSQELVRLRTQAGKTVEEVTKAMDWSTGRLTYMEKGKWVRADVGNVERLLRYYGVEGRDLAVLLELARQTREKGWWVAYRDVFPSSLPGFEDAATMIRTYESVLIPGLLQTEDYARAVMLGGQGEVHAQSVIDRKVEARQERQKILNREIPPELWAIIDEAALLRQVGGAEVMRGQLRHLIEVASWPHVTIQVLPFTTGAHAAMTGGAFMLLDFAEDRPLVYVAQAATSLFLEKPEDVQAYTLIFSRITASALTPDESVRHMATLRDQLN